VSLSIADILTRKVTTITPQTLLSGAASLMAGKGISCLVVLSDGKPVGILTEADLVHIGHQHVDMQATSVGDYLSQPLICIATDQSIYEAFDFLLEHHVRHLVVVDAAGYMQGLITFTDILRATEFDDFLKAKPVSDAMSRNVVSLAPSDMLEKALAMMDKRHISCVVMVDADDKAVGMFSERDAARLLASGDDLSGLCMLDVMTRPLVSMHEDDSLLEASHLMHQHHFRRLVIVDDAGAPSGILTQFDVIRGLEGKRIHELKEQYAETETALSQTQQLLAEKAEMEKRYRSLFEESRDMMHIVGADGRILDINQAELDVLGYSRDELIGRPVGDILCREFRDATLQSIQRLMQGETTPLSESALLGKDGECIAVEVSASPQYEGGKVVAARAVLRDIRERKQAEEKLRMGEARLSEAQRLAQLGSWSFDPASKQPEWSGEVYRILDLDHGTPPSFDAYLDRIHPDDRERVQAAYREHLEQQTPYDIQHRLRMPDGRIKWVQECCETEFDQDGEPLISLGTVQDITERKASSRKMEESEKTYRGIFNALNEAVYIIDAQGIFIDVNEGAVRMYGWPHEYFIGKTPADLASPGRNDMAEVAAKLVRVFQGEAQSTEFWGIRSNGEEFPKDVHVYPGEYFGQKVAIAIARDITERKQAEAGLAQSEARLQASQAIGHIGTWDWNPVSGALLWSDETFRILGFAPGEISPSYELFLGMLHPEDRQRLNTAVEAALLEKLPYSLDCRVLRKDGSERVAHAQGEVEFDAEGQAVRMLGIFQDITARKRDGQAIAQAAQRLRNILDADFDAIVVQQDGKVVFSNEQAQRMFGYASLQETIGEEAVGCFLPGYRRLAARLARKVIRTGQPAGRIEMTAISRARSEPFPIEIANTPIDWAGRPAVVSVVRDITERKQAEDFQRESEARLDFLVQATPAVIYSSQAEPPFAATFISSNIVRQTGYRPEQFLDDPEFWASNIHPDDRQQVLNDLLTLFEHDHHAHEYRFRHADGSWHWMSDELRLVRDEAGAPQEIVGYWIDITGRKQAEAAVVEQYRRNEMILQSSMDGFILADEQGGIVDVNPAYCAMVGYERSDLLSMNIVQLEAMLTPEQVGGKIAQMMQEGSARFETQHRHKGGHTIDLDVSIFVMQAEGEKPLISAFVRDISEAMRAGERLGHVLDAEFDAVIVHRDFKVLFANKAAQRMFGYASLEETLGADPLAYMPEAFRPVARRLVGHVMRTGRGSRRMEMQALRPESGEIFPIEIASAPLDWNGEPAVASTVRDISESKAAEQAIRDNEKRYQQLIELMPDGIVIHEGGQVVFANPEAQRMYGVTDEDIVGQSILERVHPDSQADVLQRAQKLIEQKQGFNPLIEEKMIRMDGSEFIAEAASAYIEYKGRPSVLAVLRDVTTRSEAEHALRDSEYRYRHLVDLIPDGIVLAEQGRVVFANPEALRLFGYSEAEAIGQSILERIHPEDRPVATVRVQKLILEGKGINPLVEERMLRKDGSPFLAETASAFVEYQGKSAVLVVLRDISERKAAEQAMQESEKRLQSIVSASPVPLIITRVSDGRVLYSNAELRQMFGGADEQDALQMMSPDVYVRQEDRQELIRQLKSTGFFKGEVEYRRLDGEYFWALVSARIMQFGDESAIIGLLIDMTGQRLLEEQFRQAQKMESVGTLVGGIAHDFNNMLAGMLGQLYLVRYALQAGDFGAANVGRMVERINAVDKQGRLAADVIAQLMTFARKGQVVMDRLDVNRLVADAMRLHRVSIPENIVIRAHLGDALEVQGDTGMIQQMLLNLLTNARDALQDQPKPEIHIHLSRFVPDDGFLKVHADFQAIAYACLEVRDNGCGMGREQMSRIFDPFFTTKPVGKGTGLGLAMLYGAMQTHHGHVLVDSELGEGSGFRLFFPLLDGVGESAAEIEHVLLRGGGQTILLVDDESVLIEVIGQALQMVGYQVLTAGNGEEAVRCFSEHSDQIKLVILDVVMPKKGGMEAAEDIRRIVPDMPVILHTGYGEEAKLDAAQSWKACRVVKKPANIEQLSRIIAELLEGE